MLQPPEVVPPAAQRAIDAERRVAEVEVLKAAVIASVIGAVVLQMIGNMIVLDRLRVAQMRAEERIHLYAWQLQQLVLSSGSTR